jgi:spore germination protein GerM
MKQHNRPVGLDIIIPFLIFAVVFGGLIWQKYKATSQLPDVPPAQQTSLTSKTVVLFFANEQGQLIREAREVESCQDKLSCLRMLLEELFSGPLGDAEAVIPEWAAINEVRLEGDLVTVDLEDDFRNGLASGSFAEMMAVYAIVNTICANLPEVKRVKLVINGDPASRLKHLDLSDPLTPDYSLEGPAQQKDDDKNRQQKQRKGTP